MPPVMTPRGVSFCSENVIQDSVLTLCAPVFALRSACLRLPKRISLEFSLPKNLGTK